MNKIPKTIHYCWLTDDESRTKPQVVLDCIASWQKIMPDYEIRCWGMNDFDIDSIPFVKEACEAKKWAYATDYIRLHALYNHGGVYMDTDVITHKSFDPFLHHEAFSSVEFWPELFYESIKQGRTAGLGILTAVMGARPGHPWIKFCMDYYLDKHFLNTPAFMTSMINSGVLANISAESYGFKFEPVYQILKDEVHLYPPDVFNQINKYERDDSVTNYATHLCANTWRDPEVYQPKGLKDLIKFNLIGEKNWMKIRRILGRS